MLTDRLPRVRLGHLPTPLHELPRLSRALGGPRLFVKRDDQTGLAAGGNKTRKLEFSFAGRCAGAPTRSSRSAPCSRTMLGRPPPRRRRAGCGA